MSENRYGEKREESETGMKLQNCETQESENKVQESTNEQIKDMAMKATNDDTQQLGAFKKLSAKDLVAIYTAAK